MDNVMEVGKETCWSIKLIESNMAASKPEVYTSNELPELYLNLRKLELVISNNHPCCVFNVIIFPHVFSEALPYNSRLYSRFKKRCSFTILHIQMWSAWGLPPHKSQLLHVNGYCASNEINGNVVRWSWQSNMTASKRKYTQLADNILHTQ